MKECCGVEVTKSEAEDTAFLKVLWVALIINGAMFFVELISGLNGHSSSLTADAVDFLGDTLNYGTSIYVMHRMQSLKTKLSLVKGVSMLIYAIIVLSITGYRFLYGITPSAETMGWTGLLALVANLTVALLLYKFRQGDSNMQSVWICTRNDVIGNVAVLIAALGVFTTSTRYPDLVVASFMGLLALQGSIQIIKISLLELKSHPAIKKNG